MTDFFPITRKATPKTLCLKLSTLIRDFHNNYDEYLTTSLRWNTNTIDVYNYFKSFDIYTSLLIDLRMNSNVQINMNVIDSALENGLPALAMKLKKDGNDCTGKNTHISKEEREKDAAYALNFHDKVRETFMTEGCPKDYDTFQSLLLNFDPKTDSVPELYHVRLTLWIYILFIILLFKYYFRIWRNYFTLGIQNCPKYFYHFYYPGMQHKWENIMRIWF